MSDTDTSAMAQLMNDIPNPPEVGEMIEGPVVAIDKAAIYINLEPFGTGVIYGREYIIARDIIRKVHVGDSISAKIVDTHGDSGYIELSLKEAKQALIWGEIDDAIKNKTPLEIPVTDANKGGLLMSWQGVQGFLPASQLSSGHYPRVMDGNKDKILEELRKLVGEKLTVSIIGATESDGKLIFSEKGISSGSGSADGKGGGIDSYKVGDEVDGEVTGMVEFGIFVKLEDGLEGLVHISEIDWALVEDPRKLFAVGDQTKVKIIEIKDGKVSLSIKALKESPWTSAGSKYNKGDSVKGIIIKYNKHGALASIEEGVAGLVHISEFEDESKLREELELGKVYEFKITFFDAENQKMTLSTKGGEEKKDK